MCILFPIAPSAVLSSVTTSLLLLLQTPTPTNISNYISIFLPSHATEILRKDSKEPQEKQILLSAIMANASIIIIPSTTTTNTMPSSRKPIILNELNDEEVDVLLISQSPFPVLEQMFKERMIECVMVLTLTLLSVGRSME